MLIRLKESLNLYHQRRADKHGYVYFVEPRSSHQNTGIYSARSIATGVLCTFDEAYVEGEPDAP